MTCMLFLLSELHHEEIYRRGVNRGRDTNDLDVRCFNCNILYEFDRGKRGPSNWKELYNNLLSIKL